MNQLTPYTGAMLPPALTMSSQEIAELLDLRHDTVKVTIERLGARSVITLPPLTEVSNAGPGPKFIGVYRLEKNDCYTVVAQLSPEFTARVVDRWQELEAQVAAPPRPLVPATPMEAILAMAQGMVDIERQQRGLIEQQRKAEEAQAMTQQAVLEVAEKVTALDAQRLVPKADKRLLGTINTTQASELLNKLHRLPVAACRYILRDAPYAPPIACASSSSSDISPVATFSSPMT